jgi:hypothetical protein
MAVSANEEGVFDLEETFDLADFWDLPVFIRGVGINWASPSDSSDESDEDE